jgi:hypothetical protein
MYQYTDFDRQFVRQRAAQFRDQLERWQAGRLAEDEFKPLRLQKRLRPLHHAHQRPVQLDPAHQERRRDGPAGQREHARHPDQRQHHPQHLHRRAAPASRPTRSPTRARSPRSCASGARCTPSSPSCRASSRSPQRRRGRPRGAPAGTTSACSWSRTRPASWASGCRSAAAWAARPIIGSVVREFLPWNQHLLNYVEACIRVYNRYGRRDNIWKARIKILVKAEGQRYIDQVEAEFKPHRRARRRPAHHHAGRVRPRRRHPSCRPPSSRRRALPRMPEILRADARGRPGIRALAGAQRAPHRNPRLRAVTLSFKRLGRRPATPIADQLATAADLADRFSPAKAA